ncbi:GGDEF domain-containing protein [Novosphingobium sp. Gsoil 351]|uniref:GGDEF domain-containing protein n=1 Tax=Novosphingobium sp. Gsoil 351 TaxID=2675225 RepID=UPI001E346ACE|nr:GGDEF domain-containing protein [Novosphingobium sp. Gsoil 351]
MALADVFTGAIWFGPAYLLIIATSAWCLGSRTAVFAGCACLAISIAANGYQVYPYGALAAAWNMAMRVVMVLAVVAVAAKLRGAYEAEWRLARTDRLTGALSRQGFFELASDMKESRSWTLLAYADLDGLKKLNDRQGHRAGDEGLHLFSKRVLQMIRKGDKFARLGGDEFAIYLQVKDEEAAKSVATRLHAGMNTVPGTKWPLRCSVGALILPPGPRSIDTELCAADELMYEAKALGASLIAATASHQNGDLKTIERHPGLTPATGKLRLRLAASN